jgi:hypothetical protein
VILGLGAACAILIVRYRHVTNPQRNTVAAQVNQLAEEIGKTIALPDEQASVATVVDRTKLGNSQLAAEAKNGDQLLVFSSARQVILYRPSTKKVIDMFHVTAAQAQAGQGTTTKR